MRNQLLLFIALSSILFASSCKKDKDAIEENNACTESREFWLDGTAGTWNFTTSEPCGAFQLQQVEVSQSMSEVPFGGEYLFLLKSVQQVVDTNGTSYGQLSVFIGVLAPPSIIDTSYTATDTVYTISVNNICSKMKLGPHRQFLHQAQRDSTNGYILELTDANSKYWKFNNEDTDSNFVVTSIDGIVSQSPFQGAHLPYCTVKFNYDVLLGEHNGTDTLRLQGTGRLGFR